jgi:hypothetical protein
VVVDFERREPLRKGHAHENEGQEEGGVEKHLNRGLLCVVARFHTSQKYFFYLSYLSKNLGIL